MRVASLLLLIGTPLSAVYGQSLAPSTAPPASGPVTYGAGHQLCSEWSAAETKVDPAEYTANRLWVAGLMSAYNLFVSAPGFDIGRGQTPADMKSFMHNECAAKPTVTIATAATAYIAKLNDMSKGGAPTPVTVVDRFSVPATASPEAAAQLNKLYARLAHAPKRARPKTQEDWDRANAQLAAIATPISTATANALQVTRIEDRLGGVPVLRVRPASYKPGGPVVLYLHGGAYTFLSAATSLSIPALMSTASGYEVISVDYTLAPRANWRIVTDQVVAVWSALLASGTKPGSVGMMGDSAGGGLAAASVLKMRDQHLPLPGALYLISPGADISGVGDTYTTLAAADPILSTETTSWSAAAYAAVADQKNPYVSPVYGDYTQDFPPTLLQVGTREHLLSSSVREYQAIRSGGHEAVLDVYEGMPHVWLSLIPQAPETKTAISRAAEFFASHLGK